MARRPRLLVAYDGSPAARHALARAADLAGPGASLDVVHVVPYQAVGSRLEPIGDARRSRQLRLLEEAAHLVAERGLTVRTLGRVGDPAVEIVAAAEEIGADVVVTGRRQRRLPHLRGSVSAKIVRTAHCDVLIVHQASDIP